MKQTESIEIAFRSHISYLLAHKYGTLGYLQSENFLNEHHHKSFLEELHKEIHRKQELFVKHHFEKNRGQFPIWVAVELLSFGALSKLFRIMKVEDRQQIALEQYGVKHEYVENWLRCLSYVRNVCAHYGRLYNKQLVTKPLLFRKEKKRIASDRLFAVVLVLKKLSKPQEQWLYFLSDLDALIEQYSDVVDLAQMGFPTQWAHFVK